MKDNLFEKTKQASQIFISNATNSSRTQLIMTIALFLEKNIQKIYKANQQDVAKISDSDPMKDRLLLNLERITTIIIACKNIALLPSPVGVSLLEKKLSNGLLLRKETVPLGVVGAIYESRPNVTIDIASLCLKAGNAVILRGGKEAIQTNKILVEIMHEALRSINEDERLVQLYPSDKTLIHKFLTADKYIDVIIPRGSNKFIELVRKESTIPVIETGAGVCHTYIHAEADLKKALQIIDNAKHQRPSVCNALDTILIDKSIAVSFLPMIVPVFSKNKTGIWADKISYSILHKTKYPYLHKATKSSYGKEYLSMNCSIAIVDTIEKAIQHISHYSSKHSEAIVSENTTACKKFIREIDASVVYTNASTRFTDGEVFELGAEVGISTQKLHARGPFALEKLVTEKWIIQGDGHIRQ